MRLAPAHAARYHQVTIGNRRDVDALHEQCGPESNASRVVWRVLGKVFPLAVSGRFVAEGGASTGPVSIARDVNCSAMRKPFARTDA